MKELLKKCILILGIFTTNYYLSPSYAQIHSIKTFPDSFQCDTSIIRNWDKDHSIIFIQSNSHGYYFYLVDNLTWNYKYYRTDINVKDMEVVKDTLYFCGVDDNNMSFIVFFTITDLLSSSIVENRVQLIPYLGSQNYFYPKRLEVYHNSNDLHVVMVCDLKFPSDTIKRVMADARKYYSTTTWGISYESPDCMFCERDNIFYPDDVAVTDNYVVFMGHKHCGTGIYMKHYLKSPTMTDIFQHTFNTTPSLSTLMHAYWSPMNNYSVLGTIDGEHPVWCTHMKDDNIAIACMSRFDDESTTYGSTIKVLDLNSSNTKDYFFPYSGGLNRKWFVKDIRYDDNNDNILMLYDADNPIDGHLNSMSLHINSYYNSPYAELHYTSIDLIQHSQDAYVHPISNNIACGTNPANQWLTCTYYSNTNAFICTPISKPDHTEFNRKFVSFDYTPSRISIQSSQLQSTYTVLQNTSDPLCE